MHELEQWLSERLIDPDTIQHGDSDVKHLIFSISEMNSIDLDSFAKELIDIPANRHVFDDYLDHSDIETLYSFDPMVLELLGRSMLAHYGMPRRSGRYPYGSGENPYQHEDFYNKSVYDSNKEFLEKVNKMKKDGVAEIDIAKEVGAKNTSALRAKISAASNNNKKMDICQLKKYMEEDGVSLSEAARRLNLAPSTARSLLNPKTQANAFKNTDVASQLKEAVKNKKYIDIGTGAETMLGEGGISNTRLDNVLKELENEGYNMYEIKTEQVTNPGKFTTIKVLAGPDATFQEVSRNRAQIKTIAEREGTGDSAGILGLEKPEALERDRVMIRYPKDGGADLDGSILIRQGVPDLYLGENTAYSQVRINLADKYYLKGMAMYGNDKDFPKGVDVIFNTSKPDDSGDDVVFKKLKTDKATGDVDWANPFGAKIKDEGGQYHYDDPLTGEKKLSKINKVNTEGDWDDWSVTLASQFLSKQSVKLIKQQLDATIDIAEGQFDEIKSVQNPIVRSYLLKEFASECDASAVDLKACGFPRQSQKVLLPSVDLKEGTCYCPTYDDGEDVILIRYPHAGTFEIPKVRIDNSNPALKSAFGNVRDALVARPETLAQLSGADTDGDSVTVIPIKGMEKDISYQKINKELQQFTGDFHDIYRKPEGAEATGKETKGKFNKQMQMGTVSNLITDMTLKDAPMEDIVKAVKHSMVVIDAEKHNLDWKQSEIDNDIAELRLKYQGKKQGGASTLISRAKGMQYVPEWNEMRSKIDPETGKIIRAYTGETKMGGDGKEHLKNVKSTKMTEILEETGDARNLMSDPDTGYPKEALYADYANKRYQMANEARKMSLNDAAEYSPSAAQAFANEVASLKAKLNGALKNKPYERQAQLAANEAYRVQSKNLDPNLTRAERAKEASKIKQQALTAARKKVGASGKESRVTFTDREWEAIMAGALRPSVVEKLLKNSTSETIKSMAMPKSTYSVSEGMRSLIWSMDNANYTIKDIAQRLGVSNTVVADVLKPKTN